MGNTVGNPQSKENKKRQKQMAQQPLRRSGSESALSSMQASRRTFLPYNEHHRDGFDDEVGVTVKIVCRYV